MGLKWLPQVLMPKNEPLEPKTDLQAADRQTHAHKDRED